MKKILVFAAILLLAWAGVVIAAAGPLANTKHDLHTGSTAAITASGADDTCVFCHTSHSGSPGGGAPLWNHTLTTQILKWAPTTTVRGTTLPTDVTLPALE